MDSQRHWLASCPAMTDIWERMWITRVALQTNAVTRVDAGSCWSLARAAWAAIATAPPTPGSEWARCGFYKQADLEEVFQHEANAALRRSFHKFKIKVLDRILRSAMIEAAVFGLCQALLSKARPKAQGLVCSHMRGCSRSHVKVRQ